MLDRTIAPPFQAASSFTLPPAEQRTLPNGITVITIRDVQQDVFKLEYLFKAGKWYEPQPGVSHFSAHTLEKGTRSHSASEIAEAFDRLGAHVEISPGYDYTSISLYGLHKNWTEAFAFFTEMLVEPAYPQKELDLLKSIFVQSLQVNLEKNSFVASQSIRKNVFGAHHPYGSSLSEKEALQLQTHDLSVFHQKHFSPFVIFLTVGPRFDETPVINALAAYPNVGESAMENFAPGKLVAMEHVEKAESSQTALRIGKRSILKTDPNYVDFLLFSHLLGGYFGSRLMKNIREEKGLTYGIYSSLQSFRFDSLWTIGAEVNKENKDLALKEILAELRQLIEVPVPADELAIAKSHFLGSLQSEVANPFSVTDKVKNIYIHKLPSDFYSRLFERTHHITTEDLQRVGGLYFQANTFSTVTVG